MAMNKDEMIKTLMDTVDALSQMLKMNPNNQGIRDLLRRNQEQLNYLENDLTEEDRQTGNNLLKKMDYAKNGYGSDAVEATDDDNATIRSNAMKIKETNKEKLAAAREALHDEQLEETGQYAPIEGDDWQGNTADVDSPVLADDEKLDIFFNPIVDNKLMIPDGEAENIFDFASNTADDIKEHIIDLRDKLDGGSAKVNRLTDERSKLIGRLDDINTILTANGVTDVEGTALRPLSKDEIERTDSRLLKQLSPDALERLEDEYLNTQDYIKTVDEELSTAQDNKAEELSDEERDSIYKELTSAEDKYDMFRDQLSFFTQFLDKEAAKNKPTNYSYEEYSDLLDKLGKMHVNNIDPTKDTYSRFPGSNTKGIFNGAPAEFGHLNGDLYANAAEKLAEIYGEEYVKNPDEPVDPKKLEAAGIDPVDDHRLYWACMSYPDMQWINKQINTLTQRNKSYKWAQMKADGEDAMPISSYDDMPGYDQILSDLYNARYAVQSFRWSPEAFERDKSKKLLASSEERLRNTIAGQKDIEAQAGMDFFRSKKDNVALAKFLKLNGEDGESNITLPPPSDTDIKVQFIADKDDLFNNRLPVSITFIDKKTGSPVHSVARAIDRDYTQDLTGILQTLTSDPIQMSGHTNIGMVGTNPGKTYNYYNSGLESAFRTGDWSKYAKYIDGNGDKYGEKKRPIYYDPTTGEVVYSDSAPLSRYNVNSIFYEGNPNFLNGAYTEDVANNPTSTAKRFGYENKEAMLSDLDTMDQKKLDSIMQHENIKDRFKDKDELKYFLSHASDLDVKQYAEELKEQFIQKKQAGLKGAITRRGNKFIDALSSDKPQVVRKAVLSFAKALQKLPNAISGKRFTKSAVNSIGRDINYLEKGVINRAKLSDIASKYYGKTSLMTEANDRYKHRNDVAMNDIKRMHDLYESLIDAKNAGRADEFSRLGGQEQLDVLHKFMTGMDWYNKKHSHLKKDQDMSMDPAQLERTYAGRQLSVRGADKPGEDGIYHPILFVKDAKRSEEDADKLYGNTTFAKSATAEKREKSADKRAEKRRRAAEGAEARQNFEIMYNNSLTDEQRKKNQERFSNPYKETEEDKILGSAFSRSGAGSGARFTSQVIHDIDENGNDSTERVVYNAGQDNSPDISAKEKSEAHKKNVADDQAAGKKETKTTSEEKAAKRKVYVKAKKAAVNSGKKTIRVVKAKGGKKNEEKD